MGVGGATAARVRAGPRRDGPVPSTAAYAVSPAILRAALPRLRGDDYDDIARKAARWFAYAELGSAERQASFLANVSHESGEGAYLREAGHVSDLAALRYFVNTYAGRPSIVPAAVLARARAVLAAEARDPARGAYDRKAIHAAAARAVIDRCYVGRAALQVTHRDNYAAVGAVLGCDLVADPKLLERPAWALAASTVWWRQNGANRYADGATSADAADFRRVCNLVNRGRASATATPNGWDERRAAFTRLYPLLRTGVGPAVAVTRPAAMAVVPAAATTRDLARGAKGAAVEELQLRLAGFRGTLWDGDFGPGTELQVMTFQRDYMGAPAPSGVADAATRAALARFAAEHPVDFAALRCPCGVCGGFGQGRFAGEYRAGMRKVEAYHHREYPGMHVAVLHALRAACFYAARAGYGRLTITAGYRCWVHNELKGRVSTNHMGKAVDCDVPRQLGDDPHDDRRRCDEVRGLLVQTGNFQVGWQAADRKALEPARDAPTWVHLDVRSFAPRYLADRYFVRTAEELDRSLL